MSDPGWSRDDIGDLAGRRAVVTGATTGLGYLTALELLRHGAEVVVTAPDSDAGHALTNRLRGEVPGGHVVDVPMDLANLASVRHAADLVAERWGRIDICVNNAGVKATDERRSADGFELHMAVNHLGHFAWTSLLWPLLTAADARIVTVSSLAHSLVSGIDLRTLSTLGAPRGYQRRRSYAESKLASLRFALELDRKARAAGLGVTSVAAHPGFVPAGEPARRPTGRATWNPLIQQITRAFGQSAYAGAAPQLMAATLPHLAGGSYVGPGSLRQLRGRPQVVGIPRSARDETASDALWEASEAAFGAPFTLASGTVER